MISQEAAMPTVLITGAGSGLGRGLCLALRQKGYGIVAADLNMHAARETVSLMGSVADVCAHGLDVTSETDVHRFFMGIADKRIDVLINNAGIQHVARLEEFPQEKWDAVLNVIVKGTCLMTRAALPQMRKNGFGRIINIGSIHSLVASAYKTAYVTAKHALVGFAKVVALETADVDITINTICPSYIRTPLVEAQIKEQARVHQISEEEVIEKIMLRPMPKPAFITADEVAATVDFLVSGMARNITAQTIALDGGWTAQ
jgi:3-hydroxybutyrate dehydrogenase